MTRSVPILFAACLSLTTAASAQVVNFTGFVDLDFIGKTMIMDASGVDIAMPPSLATNVSGFDLNAIGLHYNGPTDTLYVGLDTFGIAGDADGDGGQGVTTSALASLGGQDLAHFGGTESFVVSFDLNDDGVSDFQAGTPLGASLAGFVISQSTPGIPRNQAYLGFGNPLWANMGSLLGNPFGGCPDLEFYVPNFCSLLNQYASPGQTAIGIHVYMGSLADATIGDDFICGAQVSEFMQIPLGTFTAPLPITNHYRLDSIQPMFTHWNIKTEYGLPIGFGCCLLVSIWENPGGYHIPAPFNVDILIGLPGGQGIFFTDLGIPIPTGMACEVKEGSFPAPLAASGVTFYSQIFAYRAQYNPSLGVNFWASNAIAITPGDYPVLP